MNDEKYNISVKNKFLGSFIGQCLGDAIGAPVEGRSPKACSRHIKAISHQIGMCSENFQVLRYTDDSQLARELMLSIIDKKSFDPADYATRIQEIFDEGKIICPGRATYEAVQNLRKGLKWYEAGCDAPSAGNGSAMRAGPIGLFFYDDEESMVQAAIDQSRITHKDPRCLAGSIAIAGAVAKALKTPRKEKKQIQQEFINSLSSLTADYDKKLSSGIKKLEELLQHPAKEALPVLQNFGINSSDHQNSDRITPFVTSSVLWSLYSFLACPEDYWSVIEIAFEGGGDVDTTAAMAGAISGAHLGIEEIPAIDQKLTDGHYGFDLLKKAAADLYATKCCLTT